MRCQGPSIRILVDSSGLSIGILLFLRSTRNSWRCPSELTDWIVWLVPYPSPPVFKLRLKGHRCGHSTKHRIFYASPAITGFSTLVTRTFARVAHGFLGGTGVGLGSGLGHPRPAASFLVPLIRSISDLSVITISEYSLPYASEHFQRL